MHSETDEKSVKLESYGFGVAWEKWFRDTWHSIRVKAGVEPRWRDTTFDIVEVKIR